MVRVRVDGDACVGHGRCYALAPEIYGADEFGHCVVLDEEVPAELGDRARLGEANCPEHAITVDE